MTNPTNTKGKKNIQHQRPVKTLDLSGNGDKATIAEIKHLLEIYQHEQPYEHNVLMRIKALFYWEKS